MRIARNMHSGRWHAVVLRHKSLSVLAVRAVGFPANAQNDPASVKSFASLSELTLQDSDNDYLPPHLSHMLGISPNNVQIEVKQIYFQSDDGVVVFNVVAENHNDIVIARQGVNELTLYLTSPSWRLRQVVDSQKEPTGIRAQQIPVSVAVEAFEKEKCCWVEIATERRGPACEPAA